MFFYKNAKFSKNLKKARTARVGSFLGPTRHSPVEGQSVRALERHVFFTKTQNFQKTWKKLGPPGYLDRRLPQDAAAEASKSHRVYTNSSNCIKHAFSKKNTKIKECHSTANPRTQNLTLLKKSKSTVPYRTFKIFIFFLPPKCREVYQHLRRFPTPYPSREGLYGVRYPNTLKLNFWKGRFSFSFLATLTANFWRQIFFFFFKLSCQVY